MQATLTSNARSGTKAVGWFGVIWSSTDGRGRRVSSSANTVTVSDAHVVNGLCTISPAPARGRSEAACTERVEDVKGKGVFLGGEVEDPEDVDDG